MEIKRRRIIRNLLKDFRNRNVHDAELKSEIDGNVDAKNLYNMAKRVEGSVRHASTHAAAIVISEEALTNFVPLQRSTRDKNQENSTPTTQYSMNPVAEVGLLKMDFLGLMNLTVLDESLRSISQNYGVDLTLHQIPVDDQPTFDLLSRGETVGVFQLESRVAQSTARSLKPKRFEDIVALVALIRPGPLGAGMHNEFADRANTVSYTHLTLPTKA